MPEIKTTTLFTDANLVALYRLESGALTTDSKASYTLTNNNSVGEGVGRFGVCADFGTANTNKSLTISNKLGIDGGAVSLAAWVKVRTEITVNGTVYQFLMQGGSTTDVYYQLQYTQTAGVKQLNFSRLKNGVANQLVTHNYTMGTSNWVHLVLTYDTTNIRGYVNGALVGSPVAASGNGSTAVTDGFSIGANYLGSQYSNAYIDDVAVFNRALTASEILSLYEDNNFFKLFI